MTLPPKGLPGPARDPMMSTQQMSAVPAVPSGPALSAAPCAYLRELTSVRFFAALGVLLLHYDFAFVSAGAPPWLINLVWQGRAGVSFFFVLSGFILTYTYGPRFDSGVSARDLGDFARARFARIYPMHLMALVLATLVLVTTGANLARWWTWPLEALLLQAWVPSAVYAWNTPAWSISAELFFYVCFPFFAWLVAGRRRSPNSLIMIACVCFVVEAAAFVFGFKILKHLGAPPRGEPAAWMFVIYPSPIFRVWEFFAGCCLGSLFVRRGGRLVARRALRDSMIVGLLALAAAVAFAQMRVHGADALNSYVSYTPIFAAMILVLASGPTFLSPLLRWAPIVLLGEASYSLYLLQSPLLVLAHVRPSVHGVIPAPWFYAAASIGLSVVCFRTVEIPCRKWLRGSNISGRSAPRAAVVPGHWDGRSSTICGDGGSRSELG